jgi:hypothetical protein
MGKEKTRRRETERRTVFKDKANKGEGTSVSREGGGADSM